ncbi:hypothetical protein KHS38_15795 [Mucilaginibacter sp. Bleaf8]|uniref:hypothetical protein n=1 Tax=Mucilaginibacter sp. Bleaf8 TaxID=2834430 RepID=UPI001BCED968|nr:hypothetical protein [Mucilaginibacter sp. Bleaf8]MBS7565871.1 hypothetical protein [Mucilaginibacter sp. Bleaf8]
MMLTVQQAAEWQDILMMGAPAVNMQPLWAQSVPYPDEDNAGDDDEDFDDFMEDENDLREIRVNDDLGEPDPEDDDHLPDEELQ